VIECLLEDLPGEATHELSRIATAVSESPLLNGECRQIILTSLAAARGPLLMSAHDPDARRALTSLRRSLKNTLDILDGAEPTYTVSYTPPLPIG
jgi:hypothetical protein